MKFPLDNSDRRIAGRKTCAIHDADGRIVLQVVRVNLAAEPGESVSSWRRREIEATVKRAGSIVKTLNACYQLVRSMEQKGEQLWLPGIEMPEEEDGQTGE